MKQTKKGPKAHTKAADAAAGSKDRKSATGMSGSPKKGGHGGKYTWAGDSHHHHGLNGADDFAVLDTKDPNFEDSEQAAEDKH